MEEIKVNDYVRTIDGYIRKVEQVNRKGSYDGICHGAYNVDIPYKYSQGISAKKIKSHSPDIIDLIEEGDYVNGERVLQKTKIKDGSMQICILKDNNSSNWRTINNFTLKNIVTKELFNQVKYEV